MTELEELQQKHREEAALKRAKLKERKARAHRLIERGAILESAINEVKAAESFTNEEVEKIIYFSILSPSTITFISELRKQILSLLFLIRKGALIPSLNLYSNIV